MWQNCSSFLENCDQKVNFVFWQGFDIYNANGSHFLNSNQKTHFHALVSRQIMTRVLLNLKLVYINVYHSDYVQLPNILKQPAQQDLNVY